ncbi:DoxX family protein [Actinacidiphila acidipaludis]|nr:DoxX family protein [Streptomyces acidipaludis]
MLASVFITSGVGALRDRSAPAPKQESVLLPVARRVSFLPQDERQLTQINAAVQVGAGLLLAAGRLPRLSSLTLAATLVPATLDAHRFWTVEDPEERAVQRRHFMKNVSLMGGLLLAAADTHGRPSLAYRARGTTRRAAADAGGAGHAVAARAGEAADALHAVASRAADAAEAMQAAVARAGGAAEGARETLGRAAASVADSAGGLGHEFGRAVDTVTHAAGDAAHHAAEAARPAAHNAAQAAATAAHRAAEAAGPAAHTAARTVAAAGHSVAQAANTAAHTAAQAANTAAHHAAAGLHDATGSVRRHLS